MIDQKFLENRQVFIVSDGTGITAQHIAHSLMSQFENIDFIITTEPYVDNNDKALKTVDKINQAYDLSHQAPLVFATLVNQTIRDIIHQSKGIMFDLFQVFLSPLEQALETKSSYTIGRTHCVGDIESYQKRIDAVHYSLDHDDGIKINGYHKADLIITGVSRCGKTPTSLYLAMQYGFRVANYPLTEDDDAFTELPKCLLPYKNKLFGLSISAKRLHDIRSERKPNSHYASMSTCKKEVAQVEAMFEKHQIPYINATSHSIEEMATKIRATLGLTPFSK